MAAIRIHKARPAARRFGGHGCDHRVILPTSSTGQGRCLECGQLVTAPSWLRAR